MSTLMVGDTVPSIRGVRRQRNGVAAPLVGGTAAGSIRRTWWLVLSVFVAIVVVLGAIALTFGRFQRDVFVSTTSHFEATVGTLAALDRELLKAKVPMGGVLYELNRTGDVGDEWHQFDQHARRIEEQLAALRALPLGSGDEHAGRAQAAWKRVVDGTAEAKAMWGSGEVAAALAGGVDPFGPTVWAAESEVQDALAEVSLRNVALLRAEADAAKRRQMMLEPLLVVVVVAAGILSGLSAWRLSANILRPLMILRTAAASIRDGRDTDVLQLPRSAGKEVVELASSMIEMTQALGTSHRQLHDQAHTDGLTGLANRRALTEVLETAFLAANGERLALLLIDLDDFKFVNDSLGHTVGDQLLVAVGERIRAATRSGDLVARFGGDEFAVVVQADDALGDAVVVAERILTAFQEDFELNGDRLGVSCSIGIASGRPVADSSHELVRNADIAMYLAKSQGKLRCNVFDSTMHTAMVSRVAMKQDLRRAVELDQLELHYQPVIDLSSDDILGFEALVRWRHPDRGLVPPDQFIGLAEETGDIASIGGWVMDRACRDLVRYRSLVPAATPFWMSVNVSVRQVLADNFVETVRAVLARHGVDPSELVLEITEQSLMTDIAQASATLGELRRDGVRIAIDDFGTGFSSLRYLNELPVDILKIDRSFVACGNASPDRALILEAIVHMGQGLGLELIAEGIEQAAERDRLEQLGHMAGQGYLIARPMPAPGVAALLRSRLAPGAASGCSSATAARPLIPAI